MIPRRIHHCWFGGKPKPQLVADCIESWRVHCPDYDVVEWNDANFDFPDCAYVDRCLRDGSWAHLSDLAQCIVLRDHGGIYLDSDVELRGSLEPFLHHRAFSGFERAGYPFTAVWGSEPGHEWSARTVDYLLDDGRSPLPTGTNTAWMTDLLVESFGADRWFDGFQLLSHGIAIYPSSTFCVETPVSVAIHHFGGSWLEKSNDTVGAVLAESVRAARYLEYCDSRSLRDLATIISMQRREDDFVSSSRELMRAYLRLGKRLTMSWMDRPRRRDL